MSGMVLVTGGLGYLGGRLSNHLAVAGFPVRLATRRAAADRPPWCEEMEVVQVDDGADPRVLCQDAAAVVHLAGANEHASAADPGRALIDTGLGTLRLLEAAEREGVERFLYLSTAHVYGAPLQGRIDETTLPRPVHPYAITHRTAEDFVLAARDRGAVESVVVRLSNGIGAPADPLIDRWTLIGNDLCRQAVTEGRLVLKTAGLQRRDFIGLDDVCRALEHLLRLPADALGDGLFNLGGERSLTVIELAELVAARAGAVLGRTPPIERPEPGAGETAAPLDYRIDRIKATGFAPSGGLEDEIDRTLVLCREAFAK